MQIEIMIASNYVCTNGSLQTVVTFMSDTIHWKKCRIVKFVGFTSFPLIRFIIGKQ